jgi:diphthine-ammonia ligase
MLACSWSGGKDCCHAYWKMITAGNDVGYLLNTYRRESGRVAFHGVRADLVRRQAESIGVRLLQKEVFGDRYEDQFFEALMELKGRDVTGVVFGDIDVQENRRWAESICRKADLDSYFPLWGIDQKTILTDFIGMGFKGVVVAVDQRFLNEEELGHELDKSWLNHISKLNSVIKNPPLTYCGENGEYHTFVYGGPPFRSPIKFSKGEKVHREGHWLIDLRL